MAIAIAANHPNYNGNQIPKVFSKKLLKKFYDATILAAISNTDYEGEIKKAGQELTIRTVPTILIKDYVKGQNLDFQLPNSDPVTMTIDYGKYWAFVLDTVDAAQMDIPAVDAWSLDASEQMKIAIEDSVFATLFTYAHAKNKGATAGVKRGAYNLGTTGTPFAATKSNILDLIVDMGSALDEQSVPQTGRWLALPPFLTGMLQKSDLKDATMMGDGTSALRNGRLGVISKFTIFDSNRQAMSLDGGVTCDEIVGGHPSALAFASQITESAVTDNPHGFGKLYKGLQVYGWKVLKPEALVTAHVSKG
jgi:hypothetical protein